MNVVAVPVRGSVRRDLSVMSRPQTRPETAPRQNLFGLEEKLQRRSEKQIKSHDNTQRLHILNRVEISLIERAALSMTLSS